MFLDHMFLLFQHISLLLGCLEYVLGTGQVIRANHIGFLHQRLLIGLTCVPGGRLQGKLNRDEHGLAHGVIVTFLLVKALRLHGVHNVFLELSPTVHLDEGSSQVHIVGVSFLHNQAMLLDILAHGEEVVGIQG